MIIVLDNIIFSLQKVGGISVYWYELISRLSKTKYQIFFLHRNNKNLVANNLSEKIIANKSIIPLIISRFVSVNIKNVSDKFIYHSSYNRVTSNPNAISVITLHDFIHEKYYNGLRKFLHIYQKKKAIKNAKGIIVISENTKKDLLFYYPELCKDKIIKKIYNGVSMDFFPLDINYKIKNSFLFVGSRQKYKNFNFSVVSISKLQNYSLKIVGTSLNKSETLLLNKFLPNRWELYENISNEKLNKLYNESFALIYPSSYEGFGIPILESMKAGCPFISYKNSSIPEVAGNAGYLMEELTFDDFYNGVNYIEENRKLILEKGFLQVNKFSWSKCYDETIAFYKEIYK